MEVRRIGHSVGPFRSVRLTILVQRDGRAGDVALVKSMGSIPMTERLWWRRETQPFFLRSNTACRSTPEWIMGCLSFLSAIVRHAIRPIAKGGNFPRRARPPSAPRLEVDSSSHSVPNYDPGARWSCRGGATNQLAGAHASLRWRMRARP